MTITADQIEQWIRVGLSEQAQVSVEGDGRHFFATIVSDDFLGQSLIARHQMIYKILGDKMHAEIHALSLKTLTTAEA